MTATITVGATTNRSAQSMNIKDHPTVLDETFLHRVRTAHQLQ
jgi:hypothetical protein